MKNYLNLLLISVFLILPFVPGCGTTPEEEAKKTMIAFFQACSSKQTKQVHQLVNKKKLAENAVKYLKKVSKDKGKTIPETIYNILKKMLEKTPEEAFYQTTPKQWNARIKNLKVTQDPETIKKKPGRMIASVNDGSSKMLYWLEKESSGWKIIDFHKAQ